MINQKFKRLVLLFCILGGDKTNMWCNEEMHHKLVRERGFFTLL